MASLTPLSEPEYPMVVNNLPNDLEAPLGYEPEGSSICGDSRSDDGSYKSSKNVKWSNNLHSLLNSNNGMKSFQRYLEKTNMNHFHMLRFLFACKGLIDESLESAQILIKVIYTRFIVENEIQIDEELRDAVVEQMEQANRCGEPVAHDIFKDICQRIEQIINEEMYPNFLANQARKKYSSRSSHDCKKYFYDQFQCKSDSVVRELAKQPKPETFNKVLTERLEQVKKDKESEEAKKSQSISGTLKDILARVISEKFQDDGDSLFDNEESILDHHIDRVWTDVIRKDASTTCASHKYVDSKKYVQPRHATVIPHPYSSSGPVHRKTKSFFSWDSGFGTGRDSDREANCVSKERYQRQKSYSKNDSGTSVISEEDDQYMQYNEKMFERRDRGRVGDGAENAWSKRKNMINPQACIKNRHNFINEIPSVSMNSLHSKDSYAHLEEARRRSIRNEMIQQLGSPSWNGSYQAQSCPMYAKNSRVDRQEEMCTTVVYNFNDEKMPYRVKILGNRITLKQFKDYLPKKGNYRYFFITPCEDFGTEVVQEEITDDNQVLPLWEGKIDARIKVNK